jgi:hypothetical protein
MKKQTTQATVISTLEQKLLKPEVRRSVTAVAALLADEFVEYGSSGRVYNKQQLLENLQHDDSATRTISQFGTTTLAPDVILVTYRCTREEIGKQPLHTLRCSIWKYIEGRWKMVFHQGTPMEKNE